MGLSGFLGPMEEVKETEEGCRAVAAGGPVPQRTGQGSQQVSDNRRGSSLAKPSSRGLWVIHLSPPQAKGIMGKGPGHRGDREEKRQHTARACGKGAAGGLWEESLSAQRTLGKGCRKVRWRGRRPGRGERTQTHRRDFWVAAPHPVRPLSHTHPPRGALLDLATVRGLAAAPQQ